MLKRKEFTELKQGSMTVTEYLNRFTQLSRYTPEDVSTDTRKQYLFLNGLHNEIQLQLLNCDYANFQKLVDKAIVVENKKTEIEKEGKRKMSFSGQPSHGQPRPRMMQPPMPFYRPPFTVRPPGQAPRPQFQMQRPNFRCRGPML